MEQLSKLLNSACKNKLNNIIKVKTDDCQYIYGRQKARGAWAIEY